MFHVLEHIEKPIDFLKNLKQLLNENGKIYIEVPNVDDVMIFRCRPFIEHCVKAHLLIIMKKGLNTFLTFMYRPSNYRVQTDTAVQSF